MVLSGQGQFGAGTTAGSVLRAAGRSPGGFADWLGREDAPEKLRRTFRRAMPGSDEEEDDGGLTPAWDRDVSSVPGRAAGKRVCFCQLKTMTQFVSS